MGKYVSPDHVFWCVQVPKWTSLMLQPLRCSEVLAISLFLCWLFSRLSMLYYFHLFLYSKTCPLIHLSFSSSLLAVFLFHLFWKQNGALINTFIQTHTTKSQAFQNQSFHQNPLLTTVDVIFGLPLPPLCSLVNTSLFYPDLSFSFLPKYLQQSQVALWSAIIYVSKHILWFFFFLTQVFQRVMNVRSYKWTLAAPCENQSSDGIQASLSNTDERQLIPNGASENTVYTQLEPREFMKERNFCIAVLMPFSNFLQAVHRSYFPPNHPVFTL